MMMSSLCTRQTRLVGFLQCQLTETTVRGQSCSPTRTHYHDSYPISLCSFFLMLFAQRRSNTYQLYSLCQSERAEYVNFYTTDTVIFGRKRRQICIAGCVSLRPYMSQQGNRSLIREPSTIEALKFEKFQPLLALLKM